MEKKLFCLIKFGNEEHLEELLKKGKLHFSSIQDLRKVEAENVEEHFRNDRIEGVQMYRSIGPTNIKMTPSDNPNAPSITVPVQNITYWSSPEFILGNICSFYAISESCFKDNKLVPLDERMKLFGAHLIFISNVSEFNRRLKAALKKQQINAYNNFVEYFDEKNFVGDLHLFNKRSRYDYQKEYRIYLETENKVAIDIYLGNLEDIAFVTPVESLNYLKMTLNKKNNSVAVKGKVLKKLL